MNNGEARSVGSCGDRHSLSDKERLPSGSPFTPPADLAVRGRFCYQCITIPPSTLIVWPVTFFARFEARKTTIAATSS